MQEAYSSDHNSRRTLSPTQDPICHRWPRMKSGPYKGHTLPEVVASDPAYFFGLARAAKKNPTKVRHTYEFLADRARHIRPPRRLGPAKAIKYRFDPQGNCTGFQIVRSSRLKHAVRGARAELSLGLDLSIVRRTGSSPEIASNKVAICLKREFLGKEEGEAVSGQDWQRFFADDRNFYVKRTTQPKRVGARWEHN